MDKGQRNVETLSIVFCSSLGDFSLIFFENL